MMVIPAIDMLDHKVVQLVGGVPGSQKVTIDDPLTVARSWLEKGAKYLHLVDLDAAFGKENNIPVIKRIISESDVPVEVGGGIRDEATIKELIDIGVDRVIIGTKGIKEPDWLVEMVNKYPGKIVLSLDTKGGKITVKGWQDVASITLDEMFDRIKDLPLAGVLNTNIDVEGQGKGIDQAQASDFIKRCPHEVIASGGVTSLDDAKLLDRCGAPAAVVGIAIYTGLLEPWTWETPWIAKG